MNRNLDMLYRLLREAKRRRDLVAIVYLVQRIIALEAAR